MLHPHLLRGSTLGMWKLPNKDSNLSLQSQNLTCCRCTIRE